MSGSWKMDRTPPDLQFQCHAACGKTGLSDALFVAFVSEIQR
jgi:hypothetical protein